MDDSKKQHTSPSRSRSPGKRNVETDAPMRRLMARGIPDDEPVTGIRTVPRSRDHGSLNLSASRKRKSLAPPEPAVVVIPSPTSQIMHRIDSIRLQSPMVSRTLPTIASTTANLDAGTRRETLVVPISSLPLVGDRSSAHLSTTPIYVPKSSSRFQPEESDVEMESSPSVPQLVSTIAPTSPNAVPSIGKSVEIPVSDDDQLMMQYLQRPECAANMKRHTPEDNGRGDQRVRGIGVAKAPKIGSAPSPRDNQRQQQHIKMSTIVSQSSPPHTRPIPMVHPLPEHRTSSERPSHTQAATPSPPTTVRTPPTNSSTQQQSKSSDFSISNLLAKDSHSSKTSSQPPQVLTPMLNPTALLLYHQWLATLARATVTPQTSLFHGNSADVDNATSMQRPLTNDDNNTSEHSSIVSGRLPNASQLASNPKPLSQSPVPTRYSPSTSPIQANGVEEREVTATPSNQSSDSGSGSVDEGRQNALLRVSEAHLAILPDEDGDTPLHLAIIQENVPLTMYLVRLVVGVQMNLDITNNLRQSPLHLAVITKQPVLVHLLIQGGAQVNFPDRRGNTCVHLAAQRKCVNILQILAQSTNPLPDYNCRNFAGLTPVHVATKEGSIDVLKFLFQMGANKNAADSCSGRTALHYAVEAENFQMCNFLLENGCNVNAATFSGNTPLHIAAGRRLKEIVALLMAYGANPAIANGEGDFPSDLPASLLMQRAKVIK